MTTLPTDYQTFIHLSRYARWLEEEQRRETWEETVGRYYKFLTESLRNSNNYHISDNLLGELSSAVLNLDVMPSMRCLMAAGPALERDNICGYNCSYLPVDHQRAFDEALYILMCGTGVGFSVERQFINKLPEINEHFEDSDTTIVVADTKAGWARGLRELISLLYQGQIPKWDLSRLRPAGARLKTFGGRSSGPEPCNALYSFVVDTFTVAAGRKLTSIECHDIMCKIGDVVVVGGVRRSAMISLSNLSDDRLRHAKDGQWHLAAPHRALANNSVAYTEKPEMGPFIREWSALHGSGSGERGVFNRQAAKRKADENGRRDSDYEFGTNPCGEIILRPYQFCNLTEVIVRAEDDFDSLREKVRAATILGTFQSTLTNFKYLRKIWTTNTEEERLLGVSLTGIMDHIYIDEGDLRKLKQVAIDTNKEFADALGIPQSTAVTCVKPSGTVSQLVNSSSGIHPRFSQYYIRSVRGDKKDPLTKFMVEAGIPHEDCIYSPDNIIVFNFPHKSPEHATIVETCSALQQLYTWKTYKENWCEHNPSCTIYMKEDEWLDVGAWVYKNFDDIGGLSFLPLVHGYEQPVYREITEKEYEKEMETFPTGIDWSKLSDYEEGDTTKGSQELACSAGACEITEI